MIKSELPLVSVVLLNYNGEKHIHTCALSVLKSDYPNYEVIFVDNGSNDKSLALFVNLLKKPINCTVNLVKIKKNVGYSSANNLGIKKARGKYVVLLSNDIRVDPEWLKQMINFLESNPTVGVAQSMMYTQSDINKPDAMGNYIDILGFCHALVPNGKIQSVFYSEGAVMFIRHELIQKVGGLFDDTYFMLYEDIDFCWRIRLLGYEICVFPNSKVYHARGSTVAGVIMKLKPRYVTTNTRNRLATLFKNYGALNLITALPLCLFLELIKGIWLMRSCKKEASFATFSGIHYFFTSIPSLIRKRKAVQKMRKTTDDTVIRAMYPLNKAITDIHSQKNQLLVEFKN